MEPRRIQLLPPEIIHRIAAGEVVDKPASILKEFVENSVDAGAKQIHVTLVDGGLRSIQVDDDGHGMSASDLAACVQRHATSKISKLEELEAIPLLGFRGEALSAAASVGRLSIETFREGDGAWLLKVTGGAREEIRPSARRQGTRILLEDLFFNVPARRKFLRKPGLEAQDCLDILESLALSHPAVAFHWSAVDEKGEVRAQRDLPAADSLDRFRALVGNEAESAEIEALNPATGVKRIHVSLFLPPAVSGSMKSVRLTVNGRPVGDKRLPYIAREAFTGLIEVGRFPHVHVSVEIDPALIDVNIHPQKKEIRWSSGFNLGGTVYGLIRQALEERVLKARAARESEPTVTQSNIFSSAPASLGDSSPSRGSYRSAIAVGASSSSSAPRFEPPSAAIASEGLGRYASGAESSPSLASMATLSAGTRPPFKFSELRVIGESSAAWILCESEQGLVLLDQHAAHERVNFERQLERFNLIRSKPLFIPIRFKLPLAMRGSEKELAEGLTGVGFELADAETVPAGELEIVAVPETDRRLDWDELVESLIADLREGLPTERWKNALRTRVAASLACHGSVRRGQRLGHEEIKALLADLDRIDWGGLCPHGRPVWFTLGNSQIESMFHR